MLNIQDVAQLYTEALNKVKHTPQIGGTLVGNCTTVHFGMLERARQLFGPQVQFVIGHITHDGKKYLSFNPQQYQEWLSGVKEPTYPLHAWLSLPHHDNDIIDLTLAATLRHVNPSLVPISATFLMSDTAAANGIKHHAFATGDDLLFKLHMVRSIRGV